MELIENLYFNWLCDKVIRVEFKTPSLTYDKLLRSLHNTEFVWLISGDDNRAEDGVELRAYFLLEYGLADDPEWRSIGCSLLEMLIAFSKRAEYATDRDAKEWFWEFIDNLGLIELNDASDISEDEIGEVLLALVWRQYDLDGRGGLFPIKGTRNDQRKIEIWYQFCEYILDRDLDA